MTDNILTLPIGPRATIPPREDRDWVTSAELQADAAITYRQLDYWTRTHALHPITEHTPGSGHLRRYHEDQVSRAIALRDLLAVGLNGDVVRRIVDDVLDTGQATVGPITITCHATGGAA